MKELQVKKTQEQLEERRKKVKDLTEKNKQLKRKYDRLISKKGAEISVKKLKKEGQAIESELKIAERTLVKSTGKIETLSQRASRYRTMYYEKKKEVTQLNKRIKSEETKNETLSKENTELQSELKDQEALIKQLRDSEQSIEYLQTLLEDTPDVKLYDETERKYTDETFECVMNLTNLKVPTEKVGGVIREVMAMCGKTPNCVPSASTVNRIVDAKLAVSQKQMSDVLKNKKNLTLYTDETSKFGKSIQTYVVTDDSQTSYILGLREMLNKSGQCTLDTLNDILRDISAHCYIKERKNDMKIGYQLLANIRDTMSDRASTEKSFNKLLEAFRSEILSQVIDNWEDLEEEERKLCSSLITFSVDCIYW